MEFGISSSKKSKRVTEDMVLSDSVSGVSRSGRVRKKSAKLMEMEDFHAPFYENDFSADASNATGGGSTPGASAGSAKGRKKPFASPPASKVGTPAPLPPIPTLHIPSPSISHVKRKSTPMSPTSRGSTSIGSSIVKVPHSPVHKGEKVVAIKQIPPPTGSFDSLSGSAYLMGDDIHFITGEPIDSADGETADDDEQFSPLKIEVGETDEPSVSLQDETGLKMKFILSPKQSNKKESSSGALKKKSSSSKKRKSSSVETSKSSKKSGGGSSKSKKSRACAVEGLLALDVLASGGILPEDGSGIHSSLMMDSSDDDDLESKLIIAEPPVLPVKSKKKKSSTHGPKLGPIGGLKAKKKSDGNLNQQQSVYFKEKNSKKKPIKKLTKKKEEKSEKKKRPVSAYMLWCRENRKRVVSDLPHTSDFATISRKMAEIWRSLSDAEKMNWRRKAKNLSFKNSVSTGAKMLDTTENKGKAVHKQQSVAKFHELIEPIPSISPNAKEIHKAVGTTPLDVAAHLKLLGESLSIIGQRLTEHEGQIAVSGSLSVLLDSTLCALGPLLCLTSEVKQLNGCNKRLQESILDNIAYIMPGL